MKSVVSQLLENATSLPERPALYLKSNGEFRVVTWGKIERDLRSTVAALSELGISSGERVGQWAENRYEWLLVDFALQWLGAVHVPLHATSSGSQVATLLRHSEVRRLLISGREQADKLRGLELELPAGLQVFSYDPCEAIVCGVAVQPFGERIFSVDGEEVPARQLAPENTENEDDAATILYTSGTLGEPKGVMLSVRNLVSNARSILDGFGANPDELRLNVLPLSHIFARTCDLYVWVFEQSRMALAGSRETILDDCRKLSPTMMNGVPFLFERFWQGLCERGLGQKWGALSAMLGGRVRMCISGGAALSPTLVAAYAKHGIPLLQGYGLTEASPVVTACTLAANRTNTVGRPLPNVDVQLAADGEILVRGDNVMLGYFRDPAATSAALVNGWLRTGDLGAFDDDGFLQITGRKKELIVTSAGKNVAPNLVESLLAQEPAIAQALVVGDNQPFLAALVVPNVAALRQELASRAQPWSESTNDWLLQPLVSELIQSAIDHALRTLSPHEQIRKWILVRPFTIETGELTAKLSLKRDVIAAKYAHEVARMYNVK